MNKVSESIWNGKNEIIPMADVQHIQKHHSSGGIIVITKNTRWDMEADTWANGIWLNKEDGDSFKKEWCFYRHELEGGREAFKGPND